MELFFRSFNTMKSIYIYIYVYIYIDFIEHTNKSIFEDENIFRIINIILILCSFLKQSKQKQNRFHFKN
jgi:hypothetical protein